MRYHDAKSVLLGGGHAGQMIYEHEGRQYVVAAASGGHHFIMTPYSDAFVANTLPVKENATKTSLWNRVETI